MRTYVLYVSVHPCAQENDYSTALVQAPSPFASPRKPLLSLYGNRTRLCAEVRSSTWLCITIKQVALDPSMNLFICNSCADSFLWC